MRRTAIAMMTLAALVAGCQQPAGAPEAEPAPTAAPPPEMPVDAPPQEEVDPALAAPSPVGQPGSCLSTAGEAAAARLVQRCIAVSPATRPPCNVANPCEMIQGEIDRSCEMYAPGEARPTECGA